MRCPGAEGSADYTTESPCTFTRKLCVSCSETLGIVRVKVQSNGLPNHCFNSTVNNAAPMENEWEVVWNPDVTNINNYTTTDFDSSAKTDEVLCDIQRTSSSNMNAVSQYNLISSASRVRVLQQGGGGGTRPPCPDGETCTPPPCPTGQTCERPEGGMGGDGMGGGGMVGGMGEALSTSAGISLTGAYIYNALAGGNVDAVENEGATLDVCLSHPTPFSEYHYHFWSSCLKKGYGFWNDSESPNLCKDTNGCVGNPAEFTRSKATSSQTAAYTASNWDEVIGIARDGHMIIGPYKPNG